MMFLFVLCKIHKHIIEANWAEVQIVFLKRLAKSPPTPKSLKDFAIFPVKMLQMLN